VDDHELVRKSVRRLLDGDERWEVCGEAGDGYDAVEKAVQLTPDVVVLDLSLPALGGLDVASAIRQFLPCGKIIFFSMMEAHMGSQIAKPGDAFVAKGSASKDLPLALERLLAERDKPVDA
jgi:DNA-binding NarL/FixJ family response regulator